MTVARSPTDSSAARNRSRRSRSVSVGLSPVVPATTIPSEPLSTRCTASRWNASKSTAPSVPNGVTIAVRTLPSTPKVYACRQFSALTPTSEDPEQIQEQVDEVEIQRQGADDGALLDDILARTLGLLVPLQLLDVVS